ncbi:MAG: hypothetical protein AAF387_20135, partial [Pseudomonadota bacterium]
MSIRATLLLPFYLCLSSACTPVASDNNFSVGFERALSKAEPVALISRTNGRVGLSLVPRNYKDSVAAWAEALKLAEHLGVQVLQLPSGYWRDDEPAKDHYLWEPTERFFAALAQSKIPFEISQDFGGPYFHADNMAPGYLQPIEFTDPLFQPRYLKYLESYLTRFGNKIHRLLIHAEGSYSYFDAHPEHFEYYLNLLAAAKNLIQDRWPHIRLGVNIDPHVDPALLQEISERLDFVGFDIVQIEEVLEKPQDLEGLFDTLFANTANKPLSFACIWSSASGLGGGDNAQVEFYQEALRLLKTHRSRIEYMLLGQPFDEDQKLIGPADRAQFKNLSDEFVTD